MDIMKRFDVLVLGSGAGANVAADAYERGMTVAVVDNDRFGGTCLNRGCIPTKILTHVADLIVDIGKMEKVNLRAKVEGVDFEGLMSRMRKETWEESERIERSIAESKGYEFYKGTGEFVADHTMEVNGERIKADHVVLASGARPSVPPIKGIEHVHYLTNKTVLELNEKPESMIIIGGGYIAVEFGHFFSAIGTDVTILEQMPRLLTAEDEDVSALFQKELAARMRIFTNHEVVGASESNGMKTVVARNRQSGVEKELTAKALLIAAGRISNADLFKPEKTGVKTDSKGWIVVDEFLRTTKKNIWALGDALGKHMFRHVANVQSGIVWHNIVATLESKRGQEPELHKMDYHAIPRAVFSYPPIATVGMTLREAVESGRELLVGQADYAMTAKGAAMGYPPGFVRVICDGREGTVLGATIVGPDAPTLIQEITNLMNAGDRGYVPILQSIHIHPALPEVVQDAFGNLAPLGHVHGHHVH